jgi:thiosulfate/3-mercaptopyruvate sulfurtransferase
VFVDLEDDITGAEGAGRHPLPTREQFETAMRRAGLGRGHRVVVYDDAGGSVAARVWWLLRAHGHAAVAVLDGGVRAWTGPLDTGTVTPTEGDFVADEPDRSIWLDFDEVSALTDGTLIDARAPERYKGETEPVDPVAGHIPGARNAFWQTNLDEDGRYLPPDELRRRYESIGVTEGKAVVYCGSGVNACQAIIAIERAGLGPTRLYAGSWSDWSCHEGAPVATGND